MNLFEEVKDCKSNWNLIIKETAYYQPSQPIPGLGILTDQLKLELHITRKQAL